MRFSEFLSDMEFKSSFKRKEIIAQLQLHSKEFSSLDDITFSRWVNNVTVPSLHKQIIIAGYFGVSMGDFSKLLDHPELPKTVKSTVSRVFDELDSGYHRLNYFPSISTYAKVKLQRLQFSEFWDLLGGFYEQLKVYLDVKEEVTSKGVSTEIIVISIQEADRFLSHITFVMNSSVFTDFIKMKDYSVDDSVLVHVSYYSCREYHYLLFGSMLSHIIDSGKQVNYLYVAFRDRRFLSFVTMMNGKLVHVYKDDESHSNIYIAKFDWHQFISHNMTFCMIKDNLEGVRLLSDGTEIEIGRLIN